MSNQLIIEGLKYLRAVRGLTEREQMHTGGSPYAISTKGLTIDKLKKELSSPPNPVFDKVSKPISDLVNKYPGLEYYEDIPSNKQYSAKEKVRQRMYDEIQGQLGVPRDVFKDRIKDIDTPGQWDDARMGSRGDVFVGQGVLPDEKSRVRPPYDRELDSIRNTLGIKPFSGLTSRTKRGPR